MTIVSRRKWIESSATIFGSIALSRSVPTLGAQTSQGRDTANCSRANLSGTATTQSSILERVGNTSLLDLGSFVPKDHARILIKLESENPTGSMKDRIALAMIEAAEKDGRLKPGGRVIEYTGGSTGVSLALVCSVKGYQLEIVTSDAFSAEKRNHMAALGANVTVIKSDGGKMDEALTRNMIEAARQIQAKEGGYWTDQLRNEDQLACYRDMGDEIWQQTHGSIDAFVQSVGTSASLRGIAESLTEHNPGIHIVAVEPSESAVLSGGNSGAHKIEGVGAGFVVPLWKPEVVSAIANTSTENAMSMARQLAREKGIFAGTSTGGNLVAALTIARELGPKGTVVTVMVDSGIKYLSTPLYREVAA